MSDSLWPHGLYSPRNSPGQNTGVGSLFLLQGIFPTQGSNPGLLHCRRILYQLRHQGSPRILEWAVYPFSRGSFQPRARTGASSIAGRFFTNWATKGSPRILEWAAYPFSSRSFQPRDRIGASCIAGKFFTSWATRKAQESLSVQLIPSLADLSNSGVELGSHALQVDSLPAEPPGKPSHRVHCSRQNNFALWFNNITSIVVLAAYINSATISISTESRLSLNISSLANSGIGPFDHMADISLGRSSNVKFLFQL